MRLIDADKFEATIRSHIISNNHSAIRLNTNQIANNDAILDCIDWLHKEPTVSAEISRDDLINARPEFRNEKVVRDTKYRTTKDRIYAKAWNACNSYWLNTIENAPTVDAISQGEWIDTGSGQECNICREIQYGYDNFRRYCPNCGAKMKGEGE